MKRISKGQFLFGFFLNVITITPFLNLELLCTLIAIGINEELSIDILSQTPLIAPCLNDVNDAEKTLA